MTDIEILSSDMEEGLGKRYYKIGEVSDLLQVPESTLRYWEKVFPECRPTRTQTGRRQYTPHNIEKLRMVYFLLKVKGVKIEAARKQLGENPTNISRRQQILDDLTEVRDELRLLLASMKKRR